MILWLFFLKIYKICYVSLKVLFNFKILNIFKMYDDFYIKVNGVWIGLSVFMGNWMF